MRHHLAQPPNTKQSAQSKSDNNKLKTNSVWDAAPSIVLATEGYDKSEPGNIGAGFEISIRGLVELIIKFTGFEGEIVWDATKPDGQPRRMLDVSRAEREFGFMAKVEFEEGRRVHCGGL